MLTKGNSKVSILFFPYENFRYVWLSFSDDKKIYRLDTDKNNY